MPSDTAFLADLPAGGQLADAYDGLGDSMDAYGHTAGQPLPRLNRGINPRMLAGTVENLRVLGIEIDENNRVLRGLRAAVITGYSLHMLYGAVVAYRHAEALKETAIAIGETAVAVVAQQWDKIAQAGIAAAMTYAAFKVGEQFGSGEWRLPSVDLSKPVDRRAASRRLVGVNDFASYAKAKELGLTVEGDHHAFIAYEG